MREKVIVKKIIIEESKSMNFVLNIFFIIVIFFISIMAPDIMKQRSAPAPKLSENERAMKASVCEQIERIKAYPDMNSSDTGKVLLTDVNHVLGMMV